MNLIINGQEMDIPQHVTTVHELLGHFNLEKKKAIVELNQTIIEKTAHTEEKISDGDRVEIVHFVGGG